MNAIPTFVRASSLPGYPDCPRRSAARMFRDEITRAGYVLRDLPNGIGASVGTSVHAAAALILDEKSSTGDVPPLSVATDAAIETLRGQVAGGVSMDKTTADIAEAEAQVLRMTAAYRRDVAPKVEPLRVEERVEATVPWTTQGLVLTGQSDVIAREPGRVRDLKTGTKLGHYGPQIGAYSLLARATGIDIHEAGIDFVQRVHITSRTAIQTQPPAVIQTHNIRAVETAAANVLRHIDGDLKVFREGDPERGLLPGDPWAFAANPSSILCGPKYCPAHGTAWCCEATTQED